MKAASFPAVRWPRRRSGRGEHPYREEMSVTDAIAALPDEPALQPTFTARRPDPARETRPIPWLAAPALPAAPAAAPDIAVLLRVRDALKAKWRAEEFIADKKTLPCFDAATRAVGWTGLHMPSRQAARHQAWTAARWYSGAIAALDAETRAARAALYAEVGEARARVLAPRRADGGAR